MIFRTQPPAQAAPPQRHDLDWPIGETLQSALLAVGIAILGIAPKASAIVLVLLAIISVADYWSRSQSTQALLGRIAGCWPLWLGLAFLLYALASALWAQEPWFAAKSVLQVSIVLIAAACLMIILPLQMQAMTDRRRIRFLRAIPIGGAIAIAFVLTELLFGSPMSLAALRMFPGVLDVSSKELDMVNGDIAGLYGFHFNRNVAALVMALPAMALAVLAWLKPTPAKWLTALLLLAAFIMVIVSHSATAGLALLISMFVAAAAWAWPTATGRGLLLVVIAGFSLAPILGQVPSRLGLAQAHWLPESFRERALIWDKTASATFERPILGVGAQSTRFLSEERVEIPGIAGKRLAFGWHAHNVVLQTWFELGLIGVLLAMSFAVALCRGIGRLHPVGRPWAMAVYAAALMVLLTGWGMWQPWVVGAIGLAAASLAVASAGLRALLS